jgi:putative membrane protein
MLLVHPVHELLRQIPVLVGAFVVGSATGSPLWTAAGVGLIVAVGVARWFTTTYRIGADDLQLRSGVLRRTTLSLPRNRIRSVSTDARLLHRVLGLTVVTVGTGQQARGDAAFALDAVRVAEVPRLRAVLLDAEASSSAPSSGPAAGTELARWRPSWLRYSPLSATGLAMIAAAAAVLSQAGVLTATEGSRLAGLGAEVTRRVGVGGAVAGAVLVLVVASVALSVLRSLLTFGNLRLRRDAEVLQLSHGLLRAREHTFDLRRLRGGTLVEPLPVRLMGGARLEAVMTGVGGAGEASQLLPPCPRATAQAVLAAVTGRAEVAGAPLVRHGPAAVRRRWTRAAVLPAVAGAGLLAADLTVGVTAWAWAVGGLLVLGSAALAADRARSLGHRVDADWLVAQSGSLERRRDCVATAGIVGWTVRQSLPQRRAGVATLLAATAAGVKRYEIPDVPAELAWSVVATASPWVPVTTV